MRLESEDKVARRICALMHAERKAKKISQQKLCESLGITQGLLSKIENGKLKPSVYVWLTFCKLFNMDSEVAMSEPTFRKRLAVVKKPASIRKH
jgi:transcriptional regulator with XRE-family HTH domain